jgi:hypothetical protein
MIITIDPIDARYEVTPMPFLWTVAARSRSVASAFPSCCNVFRWQLRNDIVSVLHGEYS